MISTTYTILREVPEDSTVVVTLQVSVVDEVIGNYEGYKNTDMCKVVTSMPIGYSVSQLEDAIESQGFTL